MCKAHFGDDDILIDGFRLNPVHIMNEPFEPDTEFDFYLDTGKDYYLLRLRNNSKNTFTLCKSEARHHHFIYIVVEKQLSLSICEELKVVIYELKKIKIPRKVSSQLVYKAFG